MNEEITTIVNEISDIVGDDDFAYLAGIKIDHLSEIDPDGESIEALLKIIEDNPNADLGMPGPIVHFVEKFYTNGYEAELLQSIRRRPVSHTLWMLNRIINGSEGEAKMKYLDELHRVMERGDVNEDVKNIASHFYSLH